MLKHKGTLFFKTKRLLLRPFKKEDAVYMYNNWAKDEEICKYVDFTPHTCLADSEAVMEKLVENNANLDNYCWAIEAREEVIGMVYAYGISERMQSCKLFICVGREYWNRGFATEAFNEILKFLLVRVGFRRISCSHVLENLSVLKILTNAGFKYEGVSNKAFIDLKGEFHNVCHYAILKEDYDKERQIKATLEQYQ